jgi:KDO2-lipid IV(A) lauroyltransferase
MRKTFLKKIKYCLGDLFVSVLLAPCTLIFRVLPPKALVFISKIAGRIAFHLFNRYRERVTGNLSIAFGKKKNPEEIKRLAREVSFHLVLTPLETIYAYRNPYERFLSKIKIEGKEILDSALAQGNGVIALGAHFGPFTLLGARLALEGYPFNVIINESNFPRIWKMLNDYQKRLGQKPYPLNPITSSIKKSLNCLHRNEILYLIADEQQRRRGIPVLFFGQTAFTPPGPAILSIKVNAPILPMFIVRENGMERRLFIGNPITIERTFDEIKDIEMLTVQFTKAIEEVVRQYPSQWTWLNRRWKTGKSSLARGQKESADEGFSDGHP